ncbi:hypothetical protein K431DRAFT_280560 [Polychaeton citri CBS 116435]|uniref:Ribosomal protein mS38 C-terminal domain-containing protein n=1 Tax=Polychaeton citri CBS 116435 TaxID=1314669 RepID=A0A9P4UT85_9PEZI|nr:hypothetical protein K431DRAFT_280560 [Polychaeton citri CBS 116435]
MFTTRLSRVAHRAVTAGSGSTSVAPAPLSTSSAAAVSTCVKASSHQGHQRRPSSSKASCPPDSNSNSSKQAPEVKTAEHGSQQQPEHHLDSALPARHTRRATRSRRVGSGSGRKGDAKKQNAIAIDPVADLPVVPAMAGVYEQAFKLTNFFSLYRPVSLTPGQVPPPVSAEAFNSIFSLKSETDAWVNGDSSKRRPEDVIYTLNNTIDALEEGVSSADERGVRWEVLKEFDSGNSSSGTLAKLDGDGLLRMRNAEELAARFTPFKAPPPPVPFLEPGSSSPSSKRQSSDKKTTQTQPQERSTRSRPKQKSYTTTVVVTESTAPDGQRTYSATSSPMVRLPDPELRRRSKSIREPAVAGRLPQQPFLERMQRRQKATFSRWRRIEDPAGRKKISMLLISVKRQRKLKMKKHKYKKLMKRTRNLRRRLDRV